MIIVNIMGGLGNQMFQYACGQALASATNQPVLYAKDIYEQQSIFNGYELDSAFGIDTQFATVPDLRAKLGRIGCQPNLRRLIMKFPSFDILTFGSCFFERNLEYVPDLASKVRGGGYLHGYWQSESYFQEIQNLVRSQFVFKGVENLDLVNKRPTNVSMHVRRGDYLNSGSVHAICDAAYYRRALALLNLPKEETTLHIFSDDPDWAEVKLADIHPHLNVIRGNTGVDSYKDMYLMALCDHHIIANSSFSWWGAWLNSSTKKRVIAPNAWFTEPGLSDVNIVPKSWERI